MTSETEVDSPRFKRPSQYLWPAVSALVFFPAMDSVPAFDPDSSWKAGLVLAYGSGLSFGRDVVFTYGPLGFIGHPILWGTRSLLAIAAAILTVTGLVFAGSKLLREHVSTPAAALLAGLGVRLTWRYEPSIVTPLLFALIAATLHHVLGRTGASTRRCVLTAIGAGLLLLVKVDTLPYSGFALGALALSGSPRPNLRDVLRRVGVIGMSFVATGAGGWVILGQPLASVIPWIVDSFYVAFGFNENMVYRAPPFAPWIGVVVALEGLALFAGWAWSHRRHAETPRSSFRWDAMVASILVFGTGWMAAKSGFVRFDGHAFRFLWFVGIMAAVVVSRSEPFFRTRSKVERRIGLIGLIPALLIVLTILYAGVPGGARSLVTPNGARNLTRAMEPLVSGSRRAEITRIGTERILTWAELSPAEVEVLRGKRVHAESEDISVIWALGRTVRWKPNPIMQSTNAYLPKLDERNANGYRDANNGPEAVIYHAVPGDGHHPRFQSPAAVVALICNFVPSVPPTSFSQVLLRSSNRCGSERDRDVVRAKLGTRLVWKPLPSDDNLVVVGRVHLARQPLERLSAVIRVRPRSWTYQLGPFDNGGVYRFDPGTASQPHLLSIPSCLRAALPRMDTRTYDSLLIDQDDGAPRINVSLEVTRIPYRCPGS